MTDFLTLTARDRQAALGVAAEQLGRIPAILEKDVMVVWALRALYESTHGDHLSFKGGTSLSKVYGLINRFSEDIDITYDIRRFLGDDIEVPDDGIPPSNSQGRRWTDIVRERLPEWIDTELKPLLADRAARDGVLVNFDQSSQETLYVEYKPVHEPDGYVRPAVLLEFGARSTGEPVNLARVVCDASSAVNGVEFPEADVRAMTVGRTFWEKVTAAHVYCRKEAMRGDRFSRHWHDIYYISKSPHISDAVTDKALAAKVAEHKSYFFRETDKDGKSIDYHAAVAADLSLVPEGEAYSALERDYAAMKSAGMLAEDAPDFSEIMGECERLQTLLNTKDRAE